MKKLLVLITIAVLFLAFSQQKTHAATCDTIAWNTPVENTTNIFTLSGTIANCPGTRRVRIKIQYQRTDNSDKPTSLLTEPITVTDGKLTTDVPFTYPVTVNLTLYDIDNTDSVIVNPNCNTVPDNLKNNSKCNWVYYVSVTPGKVASGNTPTAPAITCNTSFSFAGDQSLLVCPKDCPNLINLQGTNYQCSTQNLTNLPLATTDLRISLRPKSDTKNTYIVNQAYAMYLNDPSSGSGSTPGSTGSPPPGAADFEAIVSGQGRNTSLLGDRASFIATVTKNGTNRLKGDYSAELGQIYDAGIAKHVNPLLMVVMWGVEQSFTHGLAFGCFDGKGTDFQSQLSCAAGTLDFWMTNFEMKKAAGPLPIVIPDESQNRNCSYTDEFVYAYEWYTPVCHADKGKEEDLTINANARKNFAIIMRELLGR